MSEEDIMPQSIPGYTISLKDESQLDPECHIKVMELALTVDGVLELSHLEAWADGFESFYDDMRVGDFEERKRIGKYLLSIPNFNENWDRMTEMRKRASSYRRRNPFVALTTEQLIQLRDWLNVELDLRASGERNTGLNARVIGFHIHASGVADHVRAEKLVLDEHEFAEYEHKLKTISASNPDYAETRKFLLDTRKRMLDFCENSPLAILNTEEVAEVRDALTLELDRR